MHLVEIIILVGLIMILWKNDDFHYIRAASRGMTGKNSNKYANVVSYQTRTKNLERTLLLVAGSAVKHSPYLSALDFRILDFGVYFKLGKKSSSKPTWFFFEFELDFYCLCSLQKSISKSNWFFSFLNLIFWNWKKFEWHSISQKSSGDRQGVCMVSPLYMHLNKK